MNPVVFHALECLRVALCYRLSNLHGVRSALPVRGRVSAPFARAPTPEPGPWPLPRVQISRTVGFPAGLPLLIGRDAEVAQVAAWLTDPEIRLLTLTGPAGVGKTRVALAAAAETAASFADGAIFIPLAAITDPDQLLRSIARTLGIRQAPGRSALESLSAALAQRELLLVLDNLEQAVAVAGALARLVEACPWVTMLVTSRVSLRVTSEHRLAIPPLRLPGDQEHDVEMVSATDAAALFVNRAQHVQPAFQLTASNAADVAAVCRRLDGLPLAIELAAAWSHLLSPATLRARLERSLPWLVGGAIDQAARLQSMRAAIAWSDDLLPPDAQRLFYRLAIFSGGFTLDGAAALWNAGRHAGQPGSSPEDPGLAERMLASLVDANLVQSSLGRDGQPRFTLLETVREYAQERLAATHEAALAARTHAQDMLRLVDAAEPSLLGPVETEQQLLLRDDHDNLRAAMTWGIAHDVTLALRIATSLWPYWLLQGMVSEGADWLTTALAAGPTPPPVRAAALVARAAMATLQANAEEATGPLAEAMRLIRDMDDPFLHARATFIEAAVLLQSLSFAPAETRFAESALVLGASRLSIDRGLHVWCALWRGLTLTALGAGSDGIASGEKALQLAAALGSHTLFTVGSAYVADMMIRAGRLEQAVEVLAAAMAVAVAHGDTLQFGGLWPMGELLLGMAAINLEHGDAALAARRYGAGEAIMKRLGISHQQPLDAQVRQAQQAMIAQLGAGPAQALMQEGSRDPFAVAVGMLPGEQLAETTAQPSHAAQRTVSRLSAREHQVLAGIAQGMTDSEIAGALFISRKTVSNHVSRILDKLHVRTRTAAVAAMAGGSGETLRRPDRERQ